jgi:dienelactone hydrolase
MRKEILHALSLILTLGLPALCASALSQVSLGPDTSLERIALAENLADLFFQGDYAAVASNFDPAMKAALPADKLREVRTSIEAQVGTFKKRAGSRAERVQVYDVVYVTLELQKAILDMKFVFDQAGQVTGLYFQPGQAASPIPYTPPAYVKTEVFREQDVTVGSGGWALPGTLAVPLAGGPFPAVVLVHGSGPNDRDETIGPNKPFRDLAWGLASHGIAVLRYEKRTRQYAARFTGDVLAKLTVKEETVDDALLAAALLRETRGIDPNRLHVLGHSLGGYLLPQIGAADPNLAGLISMAGPTRPLEDLIVEQVTYIAGLDGTISPEEQASLDALAVQVSRVKDPNLSTDTPASLLLGAPACYWLDLRGYAPADAAKSLNRPMLFLQGGRDYQVTMVDLEGWRSALGSRPDVEFKVYPDLNHAFIAGTGKCTPAEYDVPGHVAEQVVMDVAAWVLRSASR